MQLPTPDTASLTTVLLELPVSVVQRADLTGLEPSRDAVEMERMLASRGLLAGSRTLGVVRATTYVADSPSYGALLASSRSLVGLTLNTEVHDVISANGTVVDYNVPRPKRDGIPLHIIKSACRRIGSHGGPHLQRSPLWHTFLTSKRFFSPFASASPPLATFFFSTGASVMSTSAILRWRAARLLSGSDEESVG